MQVSRDPRFDELSGHLNEDMFKKSYRFLDDVKANEKKVITVVACQKYV